MRARQAFLILPLLFALGCNTAFGDLMRRGEYFAAQGRWDLAAAEYARALELEPGDEEAARRLADARRHQSSERVRRARALLQQGDAAGALALAHEASYLDPASLEARQLLGEAAARALDRAEQLLAAGDPRGALDLTARVLRVAPGDARARQLDAAAREQIAAAAYARAEAFAGQGRLGNALLELAAATLFVPGYRDAPARMGELKRALREQVTFTAIVPPFAGDDSSADLAAGVGPDRLRQAIDPALPLVVVADGPAGAAGAGPIIGVRLGGRFDRYSFQHNQSPAPRSCMYVCGWSTVANPEHAAAAADLEAARARLPSAESEVGRSRSDVSRYEREVDDARRDVDRAQIDADRARLELDRCLAKPLPSPPPGQPAPSPDPNRCSSEEGALERATSKLRAEQARLSGPEGRLSASRAELAAAEGRVSVVREDIASAARRLDRTPRTIQVARHCSHGYLAEVHAVHAAVTVTVSAESLHDGAVILDRDARLHEQREQDETFPAQPGRCAEVAEGDPLQLPAEVELKHALLTKAVAGVRDQILFAYDRYRQQLSSSAEREQAAGATDEAVERWARYLLLGRLEQGERAKILAQLAAAKGITPAAASNAL